MNFMNKTNPIGIFDSGLGGLTVVHNEEGLKKIIDKLFSNEYLRKQQAQITRDYVQKNIGSSQLILDYLKDKL